MPEGDTVHRTADRLDAALRGAVVERAELRWPSVPDVDLAGSRTLEVVARGKHLLHRFDTGSTLHTHLRMEGQWRVEHPGPATEPRAAPPRPAGRGAHRPRGRRSGCAWACSTSSPPPASPTWSATSAPTCSGPTGTPRSRPTRVTASEGFIGDALLDQRVLAGVGTFWASEILFIERVLPWAPARDLDRDRVHAVLERLHRLMAAARRTGWQASTGIQRSGEEAYVHARSGRPCRRCGDTVRVAMTGAAPRQRTMFSCPTCQGGLAPTDDGRPQRPLGSGRRRYRAGGG